MSRYIAVDCGKYNTKVAQHCGEYVGKLRFRTKLSDGVFDDDMFDRGTFIARVDGGPIYKIGNGAKNEPSLETSKKSDIHHVCTMAGIAMSILQSGIAEEENIKVAIGMPLQIADIPEERLAYKEFILGTDDERHAVDIKADPNGEIKHVEFVIKSRFVYPEGIGVLYEYPDALNDSTGIIDIGNLNTNNIYADRFLIISESSFTSELGGKILISGLSQQLTAELGARVDDNLTANVLLRPYDKRYLTPKNGDRSIEEKSKKIIDDYVLEHVRAIKGRCDTRHWPLEFMNIVCIGGTARLLSEELKQVFGERVFIPESPEYVNATGFLRRICATDGIDVGEIS